MSKQLIQDVFKEMQTEINQAQRHTQKGELLEAEAIYHDLLNREENYPPALYGLAELAGSINELEVREDLLRRAIKQIKGSDNLNKKSLEAIWLTELAETLIKQGRQNDAKQFINESKIIIKQNLSG